VTDVMVKFLVGACVHVRVILITDRRPFAFGVVVFAVNKYRR
jgi:hypothetical protein